MQVLSVRCGVTKNLGNYESAKLEVEAAPSDGQTADQLLAEVNDYLGRQVEAAVAAGSSKDKPAKTTKPKASTEAPLKSDPTDAATAASTATQAATSQTEKPATKPKASKADKQKSVAVDAKSMEKETKFTIESQTLEELAERFNNLRKLREQFPLSEWDGLTSNKGPLAVVYRKLNSPVADPDVVDQLTAAFKDERKYVEAKTPQNEAA